MNGKRNMQGAKEEAVKNQYTYIWRRYAARNVTSAPRHLRHATPLTVTNIASDRQKLTDTFVHISLSI